MRTDSSVGDNRRFFIGGSDARVIMADDQAALIRLWREKRGEDPLLPVSRTVERDAMSGYGRGERLDRQAVDELPVVADVRLRVSRAGCSRRRRRLVSLVRRSTARSGLHPAHWG